MTMTQTRKPERTAQRLTKAQLRELETELKREQARLERSMSVHTGGDTASSNGAPRVPDSAEGGVAMALATTPRLLIADEPTTGLDVSIAAQILDLLRDLGRRTGAAVLLITHDLGVVAKLCDRIVVMHAGQTVEWAPVRELFHAPAHPYTRALMRSVPRVDRQVAMEPIPGSVPSLLAPPRGCRPGATATSRAPSAPPAPARPTSAPTAAAPPAAPGRPAPAGDRPARHPPSLARGSCYTPVGHV